MIYLDNNATTKIDPKVLKEMMPYLIKKYGNPASRTHGFGWEAEEAIENAREQVASLINANSNEIVFTSGATESNNIVLNSFKKNQICISSIEHTSVYEIPNNHTKHYLSMNKNGTVELDILSEDKYQSLGLISIMLVNNEIGTIQPIGKIKKLRKYVKFHSDITQALGKININVKDYDLDYASFSSHKIYGPKGVGALYIKDGVKKDYKIRNLSYGGSHESGLRPGTLNVPAIVGFGKACEILKNNLEKDIKHIKNLRDIFIKDLRKEKPYIVINNFHNQVSNTIHLSVMFSDPDIFMSELSKNVAVSFGGACMSLENKPSRVLQGLGIDEYFMKRSVRVSMGRFNTKREIKLAAKFIKKSMKSSLKSMKSSLKSV